MFRYLRVKSEPIKVAPDPVELSVQELMGDAQFPVSIRALNGLPPEARRRIYRNLIPPSLLHRFGIDPISWRGPDGDGYVTLRADAEKGLVTVSARHAPGAADDFFFVELADNRFNGIDLNLILLNDPASPRFQTDVDAAGKTTHWGTVTRNLEEEARAKKAGLAPAQIRDSLNASAQVLQHLDAFLAFSSRRAISLEPLTYASAWIFERRGFAYVRGHKLMEDIHLEFQPGGKLHRALDGSTPFREPDQWRTVRGRAWAIHDGILDVMNARWSDLRMIKQVGRHAGVETFPGAIY